MTLETVWTAASPAAARTSARASARASTSAPSRAGAQVRLGEHGDGRPRAARADRGEVALEPPRAQIAPERHRDEHDVDVGRDDLRLARGASAALRTNTERRARTAWMAPWPAPAADPAGEGRSATQSPTAGRSSRGDVAACRKPTGDLGVHLVGVRVDHEPAAVLDRDARRDQPLLLVRGERLCELVVPPQRFECQAMTSVVSSENGLTRLGVGVRVRRR